MEKEIRIKKLLGNNLSVRSTVSPLFDELEHYSYPEIILNFENVKFISRSCADEYLKQKNKSSKIINEINMSKAISTMIKIVNSSKKNNNQLNTSDFRVSIL